jgi:hypothetical protein
MHSPTEMSKWIVALTALGSSPLRAFDPLLDEPEPFATWNLSQEVSYTASAEPTWETATWFGAAKDFVFEAGSLNLAPSMGILTDDFQLDSAWNLEPKVGATWSKGRFALEGWGWGLWNDLGWTDEGAGSEVSWHLTDPESRDASWKTGVHGWTSGNSGSAIGAGVSRNSKGEAWSSGFSTTLRRLWDVDASRERPGAVRTNVSTSNLADQWQALLQTSLERNGKNLSAGLAVDLDLRATDADVSPATSSTGKGGRASGSSSTQYTSTLDPYATLSWTPGNGSLDVAAGWSVDLERTKGSVEPVSTFWMSVSLGWSW